MKILLYCSAFNGLSQRAWLELNASGHDLSVHLASDDRPLELVCRAVEPDLVICPYLKDRVPAAVWRRYRTIIIHPGPMGDRGPSSLDWAIAEGAAAWGVTALQAVEEMDAGPIWATRTFSIPAATIQGSTATPPRKSALYNGPVADLAIELIHEVVAKAADPRFQPRPLDYGRTEVTGRLRPMMTQADRAISWEDPTDAIVRSIRAADGSPGVRTMLAERPVSVFDAWPGPEGHATERHVAPRQVSQAPGRIVAVRNGAVQVATGDGTLWIGQARDGSGDGRPALKLPAASVLRNRLQDALVLLPDLGERLGGGNDIIYRREGTVGVLHFEFYNGAMSTRQCRRLRSAFRRAAGHDTKVLVLRAGDVFSNGINLNTIEASRNPARESWRNINAINDLCREIITCTDQLVVASVGGNAGAGGVMLALGADQVFVRKPVVLNPHYATMGLYGSEYWTYVLPQRVGAGMAEHLTSACLPIGADFAARVGLADFVVPGERDDFEAVVLDRAQSLAGSSRYTKLLEQKQRRRARDERRKPLQAYRAEELAEMSRDMFDNRSGFAQARRAFVHKQRPTVSNGRRRVGRSHG